MDYYGLDWFSRIVIGWSVWQLGRRPRMAVVGFMAANVVSVALAMVISPVPWGTVVGDLVFLWLHFRNLRGGRIAAVGSAGSAPAAESKSEASTCPMTPASWLRSAGRSGSRTRSRGSSNSSP